MRVMRICLPINTIDANEGPGMHEINIKNLPKIKKAVMSCLIIFFLTVSYFF